jgi:RNA polymerase sigma-70 factor (ECF subfamily)
MTPAIVEAARDGDEDALQQLLQETWDWAFRLATRILRSSERAGDVSQDACVSVVRSLSRLRSAGAYRVWITRTVVRLCARYRPSLELELDETHAFAATANLEDRIDLLAAVDALSQTLRIPVLLFYGLDLTSAEIAQVLEIPDGTVRWRLAEARRKLRTALELRDADLEKTS